MRDKFAQTLFELANKDRKVQLITGDLGFGVLNMFWEKIPQQFINAGISEQNMAAVAAGMGISGKNVFIYSIGNFPTLRCLEQIRNDIAYHHSNVKIVSVGGGFAYGALGMSHHATEDLGIMRSLPGITIFSPCDSIETEAVTRAAYNINGPCYLRLGRGGEADIHNSLKDFKVGKAYKIVDGNDVAIFSTGAITIEAINVVKKLSKFKISAAVYSFPTIKPIDNKIIAAVAKKFKIIVTVEEHNIINGLGTAVADELCLLDEKPRQVKIGLNDEYTSVVGGQDYLRKYYKLDAQSISNRIKREYKKCQKIS